MKRNSQKYALLFVLTVLTLKSYAQSISGKLIDNEKNPLEFVSVALINPVDSTLISYDTSDIEGNFTLLKVPKGVTIFQAHLLGFKTYQKQIEQNGNPIELGIISMENDNQLDEVVVKSIVPVTIKKDTIAYNTNAFKINVDDTVEDLLKKLPGVEVDASGKVTAQGEDVTKVYVDGKEYFGDKPTIATKNLSADAIKKIEVIDEKSEKVRVSGVNDFERKKVINLVLNDDNKTNDFGKIQGGYGTDDRYLAGLNYNRFSSKVQTSIIGKFNNINTTASDITEMMAFNTTGGRTRGRSRDPRSGFVTTGVGGVNLGYEIEKNKNLTGDYFYNFSEVTSGDVFTTRTEFINDLEIRSEIRERSESTSNENEFEFDYSDKSKKLSSLTIEGVGDVTSIDGYSFNSLEKYNGQGELDLQSIGSSSSDEESNRTDISFDYTRRFKEDSKRHISTSGNIEFSQHERVDRNNQLNKFNIADPTNTFTSDLQIDKNQNYDELDLQLGVEYIEPLSEHHFLEFIADIDSKSVNDDVIQTKVENDIDQPSLIYSQYYDKLDLSGRMFYKYDKDGFTFSTGGFVVSQQQDFGLENDVSFSNTYTNFNPEMNLKYEPKRGKSMRLRFKNYIDTPSMEQLSPVVNDFNPLFITKGNPYLNPESRYDVYANYRNFDFASGLYLYSLMSFNYTKNAIVNSEFTNELGIRTSTYENLGHRNYTGLNAGLGNRLKSLGLRYRVHLHGSYSEYMSVINSIPNGTQTKVGSLRLSFENNKKDNIDASIGANWTKNYTTFSSNRNPDRDFLQQTYYTKVDWKATERFNVNSQFKYDIYTDSSFGATQSSPVWNASVSYVLNKAKSLTVLLSALDILNKNIGLDRNSTDNYFEEVRSDVLGNYYMLSLTYSLNGNKAPKKSGGKGNLKRGFR